MCIAKNVLKCRLKKMQIEIHADQKMCRLKKVQIECILSLWAGSCTSELQLKVNCRLKVNGREKIANFCQLDCPIDTTQHHTKRHNTIRHKIPPT